MTTTTRMQPIFEALKESGPNVSDSVARISLLAHVLDSANHKARLRRVGDEDLLLYDIPWEGQNIWGATAGMLLTFTRMLNEGVT